MEVYLMNSFCFPQANYDNTSIANSFTAQSKLLTDAALTFLSNQEEVTMLAKPGKFLMKNYLDALDLESDRKAVHTELTIKPPEVYNIDSCHQPSPVTFCLKELRAIIGFADSFALPLSASFDIGGK